MASAVVRLLTLLALVMMPLGMASAPAIAAPAGHHAMTAAGHCEKQPEGDTAPAPKQMDCTATCTALPPSVAPTLAAPLKPEASRTVRVEAAFVGVVPEIATPPPRLF